MIKDIFDHYTPFYDMIMATTLMSNSISDQLNEDFAHIINFVGKAYGLDQALIDEMYYIITNDLAKIGKTTDQQAIYNARHLGDSYNDADVLFDIKGDVLYAIASMVKRHQYNFNEGWFDYSHYKTYNAKVRFAKLQATSCNGNPTITKQVGILRALGIGCQQDYDGAIWRLTQCAFWGDISSIYYLAYVYKLKKDTVNAKIWAEVSQIAQQYLLSGRTVLPKSTREKYSEEACTYYVYISSIVQDIIRPQRKPDIDFSFIEAITTSSLSYSEVMSYINSYETYKWRDLTNSSQKPKNAIGFAVN